MKKILQHSLTLTALVSCFTLTGCFKNFYTIKTNTSYESLGTTIADNSKEIIVHYTDETVALKSADFDAAKVTGAIIRYNPAKAQYAEPDESKKLHQYKYKHREVLFNEVHVYATIPRPANTNAATLRKDQVTKYNTYKPARGASIGSHVLGGVIVAVVIAAGVFAIGMASLSFDLGPMALGF
jgi:hypothetical protein